MHPRSTSSRSLLHGLSAALALLVAATIAWASQTITATADVNGKPRPATVEITEPSTVRCVTATGQVGEGTAPSCQIRAPGFSGKVEIGKLVTIAKPGYLTLTCNGNPPLRCSAQINP